MALTNRTRRSAQTQDRILAAAAREFSRNGLDGARVDKIARAAKSNKNLIYLYFGSKELLFRSVLEVYYGKLRVMQDSIVLDGLDPDASLRQFVVQTFNGFLRIPEIIPLAASENMHRAKHLKKSEKIRALFGGVPAILEEIIGRGLEEGRFWPDIDVIELYITIVSLCSYHISNQHTLSVVLDVPVMAPERVEARRDHVAQVVIRFVSRPGSVQPDS